MASPSISVTTSKSFASSLSPTTVHVFVVIGVAIAVMTPMLIWGIPSSRDLANHFRFALPFYDAIHSGNWHPGWLADSNGGFGDASFRFYPPALYYVMALGRALTGNWYASTVLTFGLVSVVGALGIYLWARELTTATNAMWAGIFYSLAPYHINQFFQALMLICRASLSTASPQRCRRTCGVVRAVGADAPAVSRDGIDRARGLRTAANGSKENLEHARGAKRFRRHRPRCQCELLDDHVV